MTKVILASSLIIISLFLSGFNITQRTTVAQTDEKNFTTYDNPIFGIRIQYPSDWGRLDLSFLGDSADIDFYPLDDTSGAKNVRIQVKTLPLQNMTLEEYTNAQINSIEGQLLESNATTLAGVQAHEIVFTNIGLKTMQIWTIIDDKVYTITYVAEEEDYQNDLQITQRMKESFEIIK